MAPKKVCCDDFLDPFALPFGTCVRCAGMGPQNGSLQYILTSHIIKWNFKTLLWLICHDYIVSTDVHHNADQHLQIKKTVTLPLTAIFSIVRCVRVVVQAVRNCQGLVHREASFSCICSAIAFLSAASAALASF